MSLRLLQDIDKYLKNVPSDTTEDNCVTLLRQSKEMIYDLREAILTLLCETDESEYMTGRQMEEFARDALKGEGYVSQDNK